MTTDVICATKLAPPAVAVNKSDVLSTQLLTIILVSTIIPIGITIVVILIIVIVLFAIIKLSKL